MERLSSTDTFSHRSCRAVHLAFCGVAALGAIEAGATDRDGSDAFALDAFASGPSPPPVADVREERAPFPIRLAQTFEGVEPGAIEYGEPFETERPGLGVPERPRLGPIPIDPVTLPQVVTPEAPPPVVPFDPSGAGFERFRPPEAEPLKLEPESGVFERLPDGAVNALIESYSRGNTGLDDLRALERGVRELIRPVPIAPLTGEGVADLLRGGGAPANWYGSAPGGVSAQVDTGRIADIRERLDASDDQAVLEHFTRRVEQAAALETLVIPSSTFSSQSNEERRRADWVADSLLRGATPPESPEELRLQVNETLERPLDTPLLTSDIEVRLRRLTDRDVTILSLVGADGIAPVAMIDPEFLAAANGSTARLSPAVNSNTAASVAIEPDELYRRHLAPIACSLLNDSSSCPQLQHAEAVRSYEAATGLLTSSEWLYREGERWTLGIPPGEKCMAGRPDHCSGVLDETRDQFWTAWHCIANLASRDHPEPPPLGEEIDCAPETGLNIAFALQKRFTSTLPIDDRQVKRCRSVTRLGPDLARVTLDSAVDVLTVPTTPVVRMPLRTIERLTLEGQLLGGGRAREGTPVAALGFVHTSTLMLSGGGSIRSASSCAGTMSRLRDDGLVSGADETEFLCTSADTLAGGSGGPLFALLPSGETRLTGLVAFAHESALGKECLNRGDGEAAPVAEDSDLLNLAARVPVASPAGDR